MPELPVYTKNELRIYRITFHMSHLTRIFSKQILLKESGNGDMNDDDFLALIGVTNDLLQEYGELKKEA